VDWIYIDDVIDGFLAAANAFGIEGDTFDLGTGEMVSIREVANRLADMVDSGIQPAFGALADRPFEQVRVADTETAKLRLGWEAKVSLDEGLQMTVDWWRRKINAPAPVPTCNRD
jgi:nucleoside-diphosphate-sugar epimerase